MADWRRILLGLFCVFHQAGANLPIFIGERAGVEGLESEKLFDLTRVDLGVRYSWPPNDHEYRFPFSDLLPFAAVGFWRFSLTCAQPIELQPHLTWQTIRLRDQTEGLRRLGIGAELPSLSLLPMREQKAKRFASLTMILVRGLPNWSLWTPI